jgi:hypothetical protein
MGNNLAVVNGVLFPLPAAKFYTSAAGNIPMTPG